MYLVVSSEKQAETLPAQVQWAADVAAEHGWTITREFRGVSTGKYGARKLLESLLTELRAVPRKERPARVLMIRLDRAGRGLGFEAISALAEIHALGVMVHTREDGDVAIARVSDTIKPILRILTGALENEARADKSLEAHKRKRTAGKHAGHPPYGVTLVDGRPVAYEPEAIIVRTIFERRADGWGVHRLTRYAAQNGPPKRRANGQTRAMKWDESTITRMLACKTYRGVVVDENLWMDVQGVHGVPFDRKPKYPWPLRGALRCSCGRMLTTSYSGPSRWRTRYYVCRNVAVHQDRYPYHRADALEDQFGQMLEHLARNPHVRTVAEDASEDVEALRTERIERQMELDRIDARRRKVWSLFEEDGADRAEVRTRLAEITQERTDLLRTLKEIDERIAGAAHFERTRLSVREAIEQMARTWEQVDVETQREIAKAVCEIWPLYVEPPDAAANTRLLLRTDTDT